MIYMQKAQGMKMRTLQHMAMQQSMCMDVCVYSFEL